MKKWINKMENTFAAAAFAEAGEHETAMEMAAITPKRGWAIHTLSNVIEKVFAAVSFAEAGCPEMALELLEKKTAKAKAQSLNIFLKNVGLQGVRVRYGLVLA